MCTPAAAKPAPERNDAQGWNFKLAIREYSAKGKGRPLGSAEGRIEYRGQRNRADCYTASAKGFVSAGIAGAVSDLDISGVSCLPNTPALDAPTTVARVKVISPLISLTDRIPKIRRFASGEVRDVKRVTVKLCMNHPIGASPHPICVQPDPRCPTCGGKQTVP